MEETLVQKLKDGDENAFSVFYNQTYSKAYYLARSIVKNEELAEDVVQQAYIKVWKNIGQLENAGTLQAWFNTIIRSTSLDELKKRKLELFENRTDDEGNEYSELDFVEDKNIENQPELSLERNETERLMKEIVGELSDEQRICIMMFYYQDMSVKDIAEELDVSEGTVKSRLNYGRNKIRDKVKELEKKGTKLYSFSPIGLLLLLLHSGEQTAAAAPMSAALSATVSAGAGGVATAGAAKAVAGAGKIATAFTKGKIIAASIATTVVIGGGVTTAVVLNNHEEVVVEETTQTYAADDLMHFVTNFKTMPADQFISELMDAYYDPAGAEYRHGKVDETGLGSEKLGTGPFHFEYRDENGEITELDSTETRYWIVFDGGHISVDVIDSLNRVRWMNITECKPGSCPPFAGIENPLADCKATMKKCDTAGFKYFFSDDNKYSDSFYMHELIPNMTVSMHYYKEDGFDGNTISVHDKEYYSAYAIESTEEETETSETEPEESVSYMEGASLEAEEQIGNSDAPSFKTYPDIMEYLVGAANMTVSEAIGRLYDVYHDPDGFDLYCELNPGAEVFSDGILKSVVDGEMADGDTPYEFISIPSGGFCIQLSVCGEELKAISIQPFYKGTMPTVCGVQFFNGNLAETYNSFLAAGLQGEYVPGERIDYDTAMKDGHILFTPYGVVLEKYPKPE